MLLDDVNLSELVLLAQDEDPGAHRGLGRELLYKIILVEHDEALPTQKVDKVRLAVMGYVLDHWKQVKPQLSCPAKTQDPKACFRCSDVQAVECALDNPQIFTKKAGD